MTARYPGNPPRNPSRRRLLLVATLGAALLLLSINLYRSHTTPGRQSKEGESVECYVELPPPASIAPQPADVVAFEGAGYLWGLPYGVGMTRLGANSPTPELLPNFGPNKAHLYAWPGIGAFVVADAGLFVARASGTSIKFSEVTGAVPEGIIKSARIVEDVGFVIASPGGLYVLRSQGNGFILSKLAPLPFGYDPELFPGPKGLTLIVSTNSNGTEISYLHVSDDQHVAVEHLAHYSDKPDVVTLPNIGILLSQYWEHGKSALVWVDQKKKVNMEVGDIDTGHLLGVVDSTRDSAVLFASEFGFFSAAVEGGSAVFRKAPMSAPESFGNHFLTLSSTSAGDTFVGTGRGLFLVQLVGEQLQIKQTSLRGYVMSTIFLPGVGILVQKASVTDQPNWDLVTKVKGEVVVTPTFGVNRFAPLGAGRAEVTELKGLGFVLSRERANPLMIITDPLATAVVAPAGAHLFEGNTVSGNTDYALDLTVQHPCMEVLASMKPRVIASIDGRKSPPFAIEGAGIREREGHGELVLKTHVRIDRPGPWTFQLAVERGSSLAPVGPPLPHAFNALLPPPTPRWGEYSLYMAAALLVCNFALLVGARRSSWAWRVVTSNSLGTSGFRLLTIVLSFNRFAQIWVLDRYFQVQRALHDAERTPQVLPLPVTTSRGASGISTDLVRPPWRSNRLWIQGNSGMGKTALVKDLEQTYFSSHTTLFEAARAQGGLLASFAARDFILADVKNEEWVLSAAKRALSRGQLVFQGSHLLRWMLHSGIILIAIDGLHESGRQEAVTMFADEFPEVRILVTSQDDGPAGFETWRLPATMGNFVLQLLELSLGDEVAATQVDERITSSALKREIISGYDVRLIADLARPSPVDAALPSDRRGLYEAVLVASWPVRLQLSNRAPSDNAVGTNKIDSRLRQLEETAWESFAQSSASKSRRRMPVDSLVGETLAWLESANKPVKLVRRVDRSYEFVHDEMHAYLAARWFACEGFSIMEMMNMVTVPTIWQDTVERLSLWRFVALLLADTTLYEVWARVEPVPAWDVLRRELKKEGQRRGLVAPDPEVPLS